ncbi:hypothetical protein N644_1828 [Lactiplantibacillus paraplantarum]|nr:hypothetical protein N644_1828 [Lactiplantibacillus paraplantarum]
MIIDYLTHDVTEFIFCQQQPTVVGCFFAILIKALMSKP